jgi:NAD/NADP transhydrogenase alpha subunit
MLHARTVMARRARTVGARGLTNLRVACVKESAAGEARVALVPKDVAALIKAGAGVSIETNAGAAAGLTDAMYTEAGATIVSKEDAWKSDLVVKVTPPTSAEAEDVGDRMIAGMLSGRQNETLVSQLAKQGSFA